MNERFTDPARKTMQLANQQAERFKHEYIGTEHILLGLLAEGSGIAVSVLKKLDVDLRKIRLEVEKIIQSAPDIVTMRKLRPTPRAKKVIEYAMEEARALNHNYVGTEHLLLGLLREQEGVAAQTLMNLGVQLDRVRNEVTKLSEREPGAPIARHSVTADGETPQFGARGLGHFVGRVARALGLGGRLRDHTATVPVDPKELEEAIERLNVAKEEAVANHDLKRAAKLRDQADELKRRRIP
jgi:ATP-dependent Clp protease ATP-binding subunit ClpA